MLGTPTVAFTYSKVKSAKCLCLLPVVVVLVLVLLFCLGLKNLVLFTSLVHTRHTYTTHSRKQINNSVEYSRLQSKHCRLILVGATEHNAISCQLEQRVVIGEEQEADGQHVTPLSCLGEHVELIENQRTGQQQHRCNHSQWPVKHKLHITHQCISNNVKTKQN